MTDDDPTETIDLSHPDRVRIGATRGEFNTHIGKPRDYPDSADVTVGPGEDGHVLITVDAMAGDHGTGHADIELTVPEARTLQQYLGETMEWIDEE